MPANILIVEDEYLIATEMCDVVEDLGHECAGIADDTPSAIRLAATNVDVALVDVNLSDGVTGPLIGERLAKEFGIKVVFITANPRQLGGGVEGTLGAVSKPVEVGLLSELLDYVLNLEDDDHRPPPEKLELF
ncbi:response regulator [Pacificimonas sp. WHA3]|uniref:Response regulator n=1 Tax=Pacificimonas pallii TaxID=2827236 RepID=A0ABS6SCK0_9SPHN|nr:response regulator [Pacificimonas pallii]MBV7256149.1 response regulator [Pacificimonas pallii]